MKNKTDKKIENYVKFVFEVVEVFNQKINFLTKEK